MSKKVRFENQQVTAQGNILVHTITDKETGVQYLLAISPNLGSGLTVLLDENGKPLLRKEE